MKKYDFSVEIFNARDNRSERLTITGADSMDEAIRLMDKVVKDRIADIGGVSAAGGTTPAPDNSGTNVLPATKPNTTASNQEQNKPGEDQTDPGQGPTNSSHQPA